MRRPRNSETEDVEVMENDDRLFLNRGEKEEGKLGAPVSNKGVMERLLMTAAKWEMGYIAMVFIG